MREMKESGIDWIGSIPNNWNVTTFRAYVKERNERNTSNKTSELLALSFALGVTLYKDKKFNMDRVKENFSEYNIVHEDDLVLSPNDIIKGSIFVSKYYGCISPMYYIFSPRNSKTHNLNYLSYLLRTNEAGRRFFYIARGLIGSILDNGKYVTRRMSVSRNDLLSFKVVLPSYDEQVKIVEFLDNKCFEIDALTKDIEKQIEVLEDYKKSVITEAVTKGLNPNVEMKDSGIQWIGKMPSLWKLPEVCYHTTSRSGGTPDRLKPEYWNGDISWMASGEVNKVFVYETDEKITELGSRNSSAKIVPANSVMVALNGQGKTKGMSAVLKIDAACNQSLCAFQCDEAKLHYLYLFFCYQSMYKYLRGLSGNEIRDGLAASLVKKQRIPLPPINEQIEIAKYLYDMMQEIDELISDKKKQLDILSNYKKSLIYEYVTGKKEVIA